MSAVDVVVVVAHPDDAEIAIGGTIAGWTDAGLSVAVVCATVGETPGPARDRRRAAAERAAGHLGHTVVWLGDEAWAQVEDVPEYVLVQHLDAVLAEARPRMVVTHWDGDSHADHVRCSRATVAAMRRWPDAALLQFGPAEHRTVRYREFVPNVVVPVDDQLDRKAAALAEYAYAGENFQPVDVSGQVERARARGVAFGLGAVEGLSLLHATVRPTDLATSLGARRSEEGR